MRAVSITTLARFDVAFPGADSRAKQALLLARCERGKAWVQWDAEAAADAGPPDFMVSYSWDLDWRYLVAWLQHQYPPTTKVWLDLLACSQHRIEDGDMSEIYRLPEVVNFAGKTLVMPGTLNRLWCLYEFAWSLELNHSCLFYAYQQNQELAGVGHELSLAIDALAARDDALLSMGDDDNDDDDADDGYSHTQSHSALLTNSRCFNAKDERFIRATIKNRLGGEMQVSLMIKGQFATETVPVSRTPLSLMTDRSCGVNLGQRIKRQRQALVDLFVRCGGVDWKNKDNWGEDEFDLKHWHGVSANADGEVTKLVLESNGLEGTMPSDLLKCLPRLVTLDLTGNELCGKIPDFSSNSDLTMVYLSGNLFEGAIPDFLMCAKLRRLHLHNNPKLDQVQVHRIRRAKSKYPRGLYIQLDSVD